jgi:hypothetical protein
VAQPLPHRGHTTETESEAWVRCRSASNVGASAVHRIAVSA